MNNILEEQKMNIVLGVKVQLTVRLGDCQMSMRDVVALGPGSIIQLDQAANEPVGLYVNDKLIATGEVVVVEENFGIKITSLTGESS